MNVIEKLYRRAICSWKTASRFIHPWCLPEALTDGSSRS